MTTYDVCATCGRGKNPASPLKWFLTPQGPQCAKCYEPITPEPASGPTYTVVRCPICWDGPHDCSVCLNLRVVRIDVSRIPVYSEWPAGLNAPAVLTEETPPGV